MKLSMTAPTVLIAGKQMTPLSRDRSLHGEKTAPWSGIGTVSEPPTPNSVLIRRLVKAGQGQRGCSGHPLGHRNFTDVCVGPVSADNLKYVDRLGLSQTVPVKVPKPNFCVGEVASDEFNTGPNGKVQPAIAKITARNLAVVQNPMVEIAVSQNCSRNLSGREEHIWNFQPIIQQCKLVGWPLLAGRKDAGDLDDCLRSRDIAARDKPSKLDRIDVKWRETSLEGGVSACCEFDENGDDNAPVKLGLFLGNLPQNYHSRPVGRGVVTRKHFRTFLEAARERQRAVHLIAFPSQQNGDPRQYGGTDGRKYTYYRVVISKKNDVTQLAACEETCKHNDETARGRKPEHAIFGQHCFLRRPLRTIFNASRCGQHK